LHYAAEYGHVEVAKLLLLEGEVDAEAKVKDSTVLVQ
jgi:hypothetical protein